MPSIFEVWRVLGYITWSLCGWMGGYWSSAGNQTWLEFISPLHIVIWKERITDGVKWLPPVRTESLQHLWIHSGAREIINNINDTFSTPWHLQSIFETFLPWKLLVTWNLVTSKGTVGSNFQVEYRTSSSSTWWFNGLSTHWGWSKSWGILLWMNIFLMWIDCSIITLQSTNPWIISVGTFYFIYTNKFISDKAFIIRDYGDCKNLQSSQRFHISLLSQVISWPKIGICCQSTIHKHIGTTPWITKLQLDAEKDELFSTHWWTFSPASLHLP